MNFKFLSRKDVLKKNFFFRAPIVKLSGTAGSLDTWVPLGVEGYFAGSPWVVSAPEDYREKEG